MTTPDGHAIMTIAATDFWPTTRHTYTSRESMKRGERRYRGRIESTGIIAGRVGALWTLYVYDLDEDGYPPSFPCPCCGRYDDE